MYNSVTEEVIRRTPQIDGSETEDLPQYLTRIYARIVSIRRRIDGSKIISETLKSDIAELRKLANNLESLTVLNKNNANHTSAAFVGGTAHHLIQLIKNQGNPHITDHLESQSVPSWISAILLFLIGESPADAAEIASKIPLTDGDTVKNQLSDAICLLATGQLGRLRAIEPLSSIYVEGEEENEAEAFLWSQLLYGLQQIAEVLLGMNSLKTDYFAEVIQLSVHELKHTDITVKSCYAGPYHLALLLNVLQERLLSRGVINVTPPTDIDGDNWFNFLQKLAASRPYLWENHFNAVKTGFLNAGNSAVLTFPTGAGKTTVAELKIASSVMAGRSVLYLVPTHALEDQINRDLTKLFDNMNSDLLEIGGEFTDLDMPLSTINVMTPERCLTLLAMSPEQFQEVGLVVFDEFHLVNGREDRLDKRSLDAMYCLLRLFTEIPHSDYLLISAMVENGLEIAAWVSKVTGRNCEAFNSNWKPTRQLQGSIIYSQQEIDELGNLIRGAKTKTPKGNPPTSFKKQLVATPHQIFSLRNIWQSDKPNDFFIRKLFNKKVNLALSPFWKLTSNRNQVAAELAAFFVNSGIKTLVFVNNPVVAKSTAKQLDGLLSPRDLDSEIFKVQNSRRIVSLSMELGDLKYSFFNLEKKVAAHHGLLLPMERQLNEMLFKSKTGIHAIVATATLAQGINLPAEVVIIAGDDRFDEDTELPEKLLAHEILNAAGRAGRAGTAAQGVVLIVPGQVISFEDKTQAPKDWVALQKQIFSKSDQCLEINDPLKKFLDEVATSEDGQDISQNFNSLLLRLHNDEASATSIKNIFSKSFAAFKAGNSGDLSFSGKIDELVRRRDNLGLDLLYEEWVQVVSLKTGIEPDIIESLGNSLSNENMEILFEYNLEDWVEWFLNWLKGNLRRIEEMFPGPVAQAQIARALGLKVTKFKPEDIAGNIKNIKPILIAYVQGENYRVINDLIPGKSDEYLTKARHFVLRLIPQFSFAIGAVSLTMKEQLLSLDYDPEDIPFVIKHMATMIKEGLDTQDKLQFKMDRRAYLRVQVHNEMNI